MGTLGTSRAQQMPCHMLPAFSHSLAGWLFLEVPKEKNGKGRCPPPTWAASLATPHHGGRWWRGSGNLWLSPKVVSTTSKISFGLWS